MKPATSQTTCELASVSTGEVRDQMPARKKDAHAAYMRGAYGEAERLAGRVLAVVPDDLGARTLLAACQFRKGLFREALDQIAECRKRWPNESDLELLRDIFTRALAEQRSMARRCA
jgi:Flp pilus assembly protein TadD